MRDSRKNFDRWHSFIAHGISNRHFSPSPVSGRRIFYRNRAFAPEPERIVTGTMRNCVMASLAPYESMNREERIRRIGALFCKAVALASARRQSLMKTQGVAFLKAMKSTAIEEAMGLDLLREEDEALLKRFAPFGEFTPREATQFWGISRTSAYRRLQRLENLGWIVRHGETNAARFHLPLKTLQALKQVEQTVQAQQTSENHS